MAFWAVMAFVALAIGFHHWTRAKEATWHTERLQRWEDFKAKQNYKE